MTKKYMIKKYQNRKFYDSNVKDWIDLSEIANQHINNINLQIINHDSENITLDTLCKSVSLLLSKKVSKLKKNQKALILASLKTIVGVLNE